MGLTCSLVGHDFGDRVTERERTDHGTEAVTTVRAIETCQRCGDTRVIAENTEITTTPENNGIESHHSTDENNGKASPNNASTGETGSGGDAEPKPSDSDGPIGPTAAVVAGRSLEASELYCQNCAFVEPVLGSALRAGDNCPQCVRGYLARRTRKE